jgi:hypothetical protein
VRIDRSLKGIGAGVVLALIVSALLALLAPFYLIPIYNHIASAASPARGTAHPILYHPVAVAMTLLTSALQVGPSAYLAARVADHRFIPHALVATAVYLLLAGVLAPEVVIWSPLYFIGISAWSLLVATGAGYVRYRQVTATARLIR